MQAGARREKIDALVSGPNAIQLHGMVEVFGLHANRVTNSGKRNRFGLRETVVDYTKDAGFDARMAEIQSRVDEVFTAMGAQKSGKPTVSWRADHAASTCRMGLTEADSVVDKNLRVHGIENLYVCSNAVFPSLGAINPTLTLTALALRLGDHLVGAGTAVEGP